MNLTDEVVTHVRDAIVSEWGDPIKAVSSSIRGFLQASPGREFLVCDFSQIEARGVAWFAKNEAVLDLYRRDEDVYRHVAARMFNVDLPDVTDHQRTGGKVCELALGYQGWVGAFQNMAKAYQFLVPEDVAREMCNAWRENHPLEVALWRALETCAMRALGNPGVRFGDRSKPSKWSFLYDPKWIKVGAKFIGCLKLRLPSGREICYPRPEITDNKYGRPSVVYHKMVGKCLVSEDMYGGKWLENLVQGWARDMLTFALINCEDAGLPTVGHVHDEGVFEPCIGEFTPQQVTDIFTIVPEWSAGCPIAAKAWAGGRYDKQ